MKLHGKDWALEITLSGPWQPAVWKWHDWTIRITKVGPLRVYWMDRIRP